MYSGHLTYSNLFNLHNKATKNVRSHVIGRETQIREVKRVGEWGTWGSESLLVITVYILASSVHAVAFAYTSVFLISLRGSDPGVHMG